MFKRPKTFEECTARRKQLYENYNLYHIPGNNQAQGYPEAAEEYNWLADIHGRLPHAAL